MWADGSRMLLLLLSYIVPDVSDIYMASQSKNDILALIDHRKLLYMSFIIKITIKSISYHLIDNTAVLIDQIMPCLIL